MLRLRWFDREPGDQATPIPWAHVAVVTATVFLNFPFWIDRGSILWIPGSFLRNAAFAAAAAALMAGLFVGGPTLMCQAAKRPFFEVINTSFGSLPAAGLRLCCAVLLTAWIADLVSFPASRFITFILRHGLSRLTLYMGPLVLLAAVFGHRLRTRRDAALIASMGVALPLFGTVLLVYVISFATYGAGYYRPSLTPNVAMAL